MKKEKHIKLKPMPTRREARVSFFRARGQEVVTRLLLLNYEAEQPESLVVIDRVQAGIDPRTRRCSLRMKKEKHT